MRRLSGCSSREHVFSPWLCADDSMGRATGGWLLAAHVDALGKGALNRCGHLSLSRSFSACLAC
eukprot:COSAG03_NODE_89_length_13462_cov_21.049764_20_plen_64_part_00